jgi:asparagine synthase (glutamine-hydrolysing)
MKNMHFPTVNSSAATSEANCLAIGKPVFSNTMHANIARQDGIASAWQQAFRAGGVRAPEAVSGDFAIALREPDGQVFMAVDRFAIRSLCYRQVGNSLEFAERADELADATTELDPQAIFDYLYFHAIPSPRTIFKGIYRVPPAHYVLFEKGQVTVAPYWTPSFEESLSPSFDKLRDEFRQILESATARQLDGGKPGCFLSGGTDSSTVAGMIGLASGQPPATYSIGFEAEGYDEMEFARIAANQFKTEHHEYYVTPDDLIRSIPAVAASYDQPFGNSSALPAYYCAKMAKDDGVTRILAGDGGDELFGGNSRYAKQQLFDLYQHIPGALRAGLLEPLLGTSFASSLPLARKAASYVEQASVPMPDRLQMYNLITRLGIEQVLSKGFLAQVDIFSPLQHQRGVWVGAQTKSNTNRELAFDWRYTLAESDLPKVCGTTRLAGLDVGFPMLDDDLLAFSMRLPISYKLKGQKLRWFFKEALRGFLPDEIIVKKKQGFGLPFGVWLTRHDALRQLARNSVMGLVDRGILRGEFVEQLFNKHLQEHPGYYGEMIWISMMLEQWLLHHATNYSI